MSYLLPESVVDALMDKLGHDESFRARFTADPRACLAGLGFAPAADPTVTAGIWACMQVDALASMESIRASHVELRAQLTRAALFTPFHLGHRVDEKAA